ncbi:MAG: hypothetical protein AAF533_08005 [Acidobacteriota bacterium]
MTRHALPSVLVTALLLGACGPSPPGVIVRAQVGEHELGLLVPEGWQHFDNDRQHRLQREIARIEIEDLGPLSLAGLEREVVRARELFRDGRRDDARSVLRGLDPAATFPTPEDWKAASPSWWVALQAKEEFGSGPIEEAYSRLLTQLSELPDKSLEDRARQVLTRFGHDSARDDIASVETVEVGGRPAVLLMTWDRLSHAQRKRHCFVENRGNLLVLRMGLGQHEEMETAFESVVDWLDFA